MGRGVLVARLLRSPDLKPMDCFLWDYMKPLVYTERSNSRAELINSVIDAADQIRNDQEMMIRAVILIVERSQTCVDTKVGHLHVVRSYSRFV
jgi:hypothetical protein